METTDQDALEPLRAVVAQVFDEILPSGAVWRVSPIGDWPEIEIIHHGKVYFLRLLKHPGPDAPSAKYLSPEAKRVHNELIHAGAHVWICHSMSDVKSVLRELGLVDVTPGPTASGPA